MPSANQILQQAGQQYQRNLQSVNPANLAGSLIYTSQYSDEALADAKKRAAKGDVVSQLYVSTAENILKPVQETYQRDSKNANPVVAFTSGLVQTLPNVIATIPAGLQAVNLLQQGQKDVVKKGYQSIPGIITDTISSAKDSPLGFAGTLAGGVALGGAGAGRVKITKGTTKTQDSAVSNTGKTTPQTQTKLVTQLPRSAFNSKITNRGPNTQRQILTQKRGADNAVKVQPAGIKTTPASTTAQQRTVIRGNVPSEFSGNVGKGYSADVKIRGNTFVLTPMDNRITINTPAPSTLRPVSFDDIVQNLVKGQGIAIKTGDRMGTVTRPAGPVGATLEPGGGRARFPDYQPNIYRPISSDDYFASAIGGRKNAGVDIYTYPFGVQRDFSPNLTPKSIKALNADTLFRLMDKTLNPAPQRPQDLSAFRDNPRVKEIELVEVGQTTKPRELPANIQPLRTTRITEYVTEYQKISFIGQKAKSTSRPSAKAVDRPAPKQSGRSLTFTKQPAGTVSTDSGMPMTSALPSDFSGVVVSTLILPDAKISSIPATVTPIPGDADVVISTTVTGDTAVTVTAGDTDSSSPLPSDMSSPLPVVRPGDADASVARRLRRTNSNRPGSRARVRVRDSDTEDSGLRRLQRRDTDAVTTRRRRRRKDSQDEEEEDKKKKKMRKTTKRTYRQKVNPLPWLEDAKDTSWLRKDLTFMRMPAKVKVTAVRPALEAYNDKVKAFNTARKKMRNTALQTTADGRKALSTLKRLYKAAVEAREGVVKLIEKNRR